jgi:cell shape-determining protein MreC
MSIFTELEVKKMTDEKLINLIVALGSEEQENFKLIRREVESRLTERKKLKEENKELRKKVCSARNAGGMLRSAGLIF